MLRLTSTRSWEFYQQSINVNNVSFESWRILLAEMCMNFERLKWSEDWQILLTCPSLEIALTSCCVTAQIEVISRHPWTPCTVAIAKVFCAAVTSLPRVLLYPQISRGGSCEARVSRWPGGNLEESRPSILSLLLRSGAQTPRALLYVSVTQGIFGTVL